MKKIYINKDDELNLKRLTSIIQYFNQNIKPELLFNKGYYNGTGQQIMRREMADAAKPNNKIVMNYCKTIVDNFRGYICGVPITYTPVDAEQDITPLLELLRANDVQNHDSEWLKNALVYGVAPELCYMNERGEKKFKLTSPEQTIPVYSADLDEELLYVIYCYPLVDWAGAGWAQPQFGIDVYDNFTISHFKSDSNFQSIIPCGEVEEHLFNEVPFTFFYLTDDGESIFKPIISLQDAYNKLLSDSINDWEAFVDAYMVLKNLTAGEEELAQMKKNRILLLDDDSEASYLTKNTSDTQVQNLLDDINVGIHTIANSPDFSSEEFGAGVSSGIALQFKLVGFNNIAANIEGQFRKAINKRIELLNNLFNLIDLDNYDVNITFTHNLPQNIADTADTVNKLRGLVSNETLLAQLPFVNDVAAEVEKVSKENESQLDLYNFDVEE